MGLKIAIFLLAMVLWYLLISLVVWEINIAHWGVFARFLFSLFLLLTIVGVSTDD